MNMSRFLNCLIVGLALVAFVPACSSTRKQESAGEYIDNSALTSKVKTAIFNDPELKTLQISVESFKGVVQLSGFVDSAQMVAKAGKVAASVEGVESVRNSLVVK